LFASRTTSLADVTVSPGYDEYGAQPRVTVGFGNGRFSVTAVCNVLSSAVPDTTVMVLTGASEASNDPVSSVVIQDPKRRASSPSTAVSVAMVQSEPPGWSAETRSFQYHSASGSSLQQVALKSLASSPFSTAIAVARVYSQPPNMSVETSSVFSASASCFEQSRGSLVGVPSVIGTLFGRFGAGDLQSGSHSTKSLAVWKPELAYRQRHRSNSLVLGDSTATTDQVLTAALLVGILLELVLLVAISLCRRITRWKQERATTQGGGRHIRFATSVTVREYDRTVGMMPHKEPSCRRRKRRVVHRSKPFFPLALDWTYVQFQADFEVFGQSPGRRGNWFDSAGLRQQVLLAHGLELQAIEQMDKAARRTFDADALLDAELDRDESGGVAR
jgi:hypothetical protein